MASKADTAKKRTKRPLKGLLDFYSETGTEGGYWAFQDSQFIFKTTPEYGVWSGMTVWDQAQPDRKGKVAEEGAEVLKNGEWLPLQDPLMSDPDYVASSLWCGEDRGDREADERLMERYGFKMIYAAERLDLDYGKGNWWIEPSGSVVAKRDGKEIHVYIGEGTPETEPNRPYGVAPGELTRVMVNWEDGQEEQRLSDSLLVERWDHEGQHILDDGDQLRIIHPATGEIVWEGVVDLEQIDSFNDGIDGFGMRVHSRPKNVEPLTWAKWFVGEYPAELIRK